MVVEGSLGGEVEANGFAWRSESVNNAPDGRADERTMVSLCSLLSFLLFFSSLVDSRNVFLDRPAPDVSALIAHSGFRVELHQVVSADGYQLSLRKLINPKLRGSRASRRPILLIPGAGCTSGTYLLRALDADARDLSRVDLSKLSEQRAIDLLRNEPASGSYAYLAAQLGYQVWLLERRGMPDSLGHISPNMRAYKNKSMVLGEGVQTERCASGDPSGGDYDPIQDIVRMIDYYERNAVNPDYWRFSLDEEAKYDIPAVVDHVLKASGADKLALIGHSAGANLILMASIVEESLASKVFATILLAPVVYQLPERRPLAWMDVLGPEVFNRSLPLQPKVSTDTCKCLFERLCSGSAESGKSACRRTLIANSTVLAVGRIVHSRLPASIRTRLHIPRWKGRYRLGHFDFGDPNANLAKYAQKEPPVYDMTQVGLERITIMSGSNDTEITREEILLLSDDLVNEPKYYYVQRAGVFFGHESSLFHWNVSTLAVIPMLRDIQLADTQDMSANSPPFFQCVGNKIRGWISALISALSG